MKLLKITLNFILLFAIASSLSMAVTSCDKAKDATLSAIVVAANSQCPVDIAPGFTFASVTDDGTDVIYTYVVNDSIYPFEMITENMNGATTDLINEMIADNDARTFISAVSETGRGLTFRYCSANDTLNIRADNAEIKEILKDNKVTE